MRERIDRFGGCFLWTAIFLGSLCCGESVGGEIDRQLDAELFSKAKSAVLAPRCDDETFLRRVYLDVVGEPPLPGEISAFALDPSADKRARTIDRLLADPRYGANWARYWRDVIFYRRTVAEIQGLALVAQPLEQFLTDSLNRNDGWDRIARAFVEAQGVVAEHGETALFMAHMSQTSAVAAETSRIFLGVQIQCAECHDHPFDKWKRPQFHEFAAFFPRVGVQRGRSENGQASLSIASADDGPQARRPGSPQGGREHFMPDLKDPTAQGTLMQPVFFVGNKKLETGTSDAERRAALGRWLTAKDNPWFAKALVNRIWAELVGEGFCATVDDLGPEREMVAPETWAYLTDDFAAGNFDLKRLFREILTSDAYQRECRPPRQPDETPFTANVRQPLRADPLLAVLGGALGYYIGGDPRGLTTQGNAFAAYSGPRNQLVQLFGYDPSVRRDEVAHTMPQALVLMNSQLVNRALAMTGSSWFGKLLQTANDDVVLAELYLRTLAREPNDDELAVCREHLKSPGGRTAGFEDIFWSLLNSEELRYRN